MLLGRVPKGIHCHHGLRLEKVLILAAMVKSIDANNLSIKSRERLWAVTTRKLPVMTRIPRNLLPMTAVAEVLVMRERTIVMACRGRASLLYTRTLSFEDTNPMERLIFDAARHVPDRDTMSSTRRTPSIQCYATNNIQFKFEPSDSWLESFCGPEMYRNTLQYYFKQKALDMVRIRNGIVVSLHVHRQSAYYR